MVLPWVPSFCFFLSFVLDQLLQDQVPRFVIAWIAAAGLDLPGGLCLHPPQPFIFQEAVSPFYLSVGPQRQGKSGGPWAWRHQIVLSDTVLFPTETHWCFAQAFSKDLSNTMACYLCLEEKWERSVSPAWSSAERRGDSDLKKWLRDDRRGAEEMPTQGSEARAGKQQLKLSSAPWECSLKALRNTKRKESRKRQPGL